MQLQLILDTQHICGINDCDAQADRFYAFENGDYGGSLGVCSECEDTLGLSGGKPITEDEFEVLQVMAL